MKYKELLEGLKNLTEEQLEQEVIVLSESLLESINGIKLEILEEDSYSEIGSVSCLEEDQCLEDFEKVANKGDVYLIGN